MKKQLAIVIPAYKRQFFAPALKSIADQTNQNFHLYIGDDCSPEDLQPLVTEFSSKISLTYKRFERNMGGNDLVGHWERCIAMTEEEEWIWLFSDDDTMHPDCVEAFYSSLQNEPERKLFHFDVQIVDEDHNIIRASPKFPKNLHVSDFHLKKWNSQLFSYVVEYIFSKSYFIEKNGFQKFEYAWHSDIATWTKLGYPNGIATIKGGGVNWRKSSINITPNNTDSKIVKGKLCADVRFAEWLIDFYHNNNLQFSGKHKFHIVKRHVQHLYRCKDAMKPGEWNASLKKQLKALNLSNYYCLWYMYYQFRNIKSLIQKEN